jgi:hypothetical protein
LYTILANVFLAPWGLASTQQAGSVLLAIVALLAKATAIGAVVAVIDNLFDKLRLFKITEFVAGAFLLTTTVFSRRSMWRFEAFPRWAAPKGHEPSSPMRHRIKETGVPRSFRLRSALVAHRRCF